MILEGDFREILLDAFEKRVGKNPAYSLRAFARDLQVSPAHLSQIVRGKEGLSRASALRVAEVLFDSASEIKHFCSLVESQHARSFAGREGALKNLGEQWTREKKKLNIADFSKVMDWYHLALLHLADLETFQSDENWMAAYLGITPEQTANAIHQLLELKLLVQTSTGLKRVQGAFIHSEKIPRPILREYHRQILEKAILAIDGQTIDQRFLSSITFGASAENLNEMKDCIKKFVADIERISYTTENSKKKDRLYCLSLQLFDLETTNSKINLINKIGASNA